MVLKPFDIDIVKKANPSALLEKFEKEGYDFYGVFEPLGSTVLSDGSILFIQQKVNYYSSITIVKDMDIYYEKRVYSTYITKFNSKGKLVWQEVIPQYQVGTMWNLGARVFFNGDNAYIVTNDNALNAKHTNDTFETVKPFDTHVKSEVVIFKVDKNGEVTNSIVAKASQNLPKLMPMYKPYVTNKAIILPTYVTKTTYGLGIISLE